MPKEHLLVKNVRLADPFVIALGDYLLALKSEGKSPKTLQNYEHILRDFHAFAGSVDPADIDQRLVRRWLAGLAERGLTGTSRHSYVSKLKTWLRWLCDEGDYGVDDGWLRRVKAPNLDTEQPDPFDDATLVALFDRCPTSSFPGLRLRAMLAVLVDTGVRLSELIGLTLADVDLESGRLQVRAETSKSRRSRTIALGAKARREVGRYWRDARKDQALAPASPFFCTKDAKALTARNVDHLLERLAARLGRDDVHAHRFRHTFAYGCARARYNPITIQALLGHKDLRMTMRYIKLAEQEGVDEEKLARSPLDQIKWR